MKIQSPRVSNDGMLRAGLGMGCAPACEITPLSHPPMASRDRAKPDSALGGIGLVGVMGESSSCLKHLCSCCGWAKAELLATEHLGLRFLEMSDGPAGFGSTLQTPSPEMSPVKGELDVPAVLFPQGS